MSVRRRIEPLEFLARIVISCPSDCSSESVKSSVPKYDCRFVRCEGGGFDAECVSDFIPEPLFNESDMVARSSLYTQMAGADERGIR